VIDAISKYYQKLMQTFIATTLSQLATDAYDLHVVKFQTTSMLNFHEVPTPLLNQFRQTDFPLF
jgi:hypothetical protein